MKSAMKDAIFWRTPACTFLRLFLAFSAICVAPAALADISINTGGSATGSYVADRNFTGGSAYTYGTQTGVYDTERWSTSSFSYAIPVTA